MYVTHVVNLSIALESTQFAPSTVPARIFGAENSPVGAYKLVYLISYRSGDQAAQLGQRGERLLKVLADFEDGVRFTVEAIPCDEDNRLKVLGSLPRLLLKQRLPNGRLLRCKTVAPLGPKGDAVKDERRHSGTAVKMSGARQCVGVVIENCSGTFSGSRSCSMKKFTDASQKLQTPSNRITPRGSFRKTAAWAPALAPPLVQNHSWKASSNSNPGPRVYLRFVAASMSLDSKFLGDDGLVVGGRRSAVGCRWSVVA